MVIRGLGVRLVTQRVRNEELQSYIEILNLTMVRTTLFQLPFSLIILHRSVP